MIEWIKDNQWIFLIIASIGTIIANYFLIRNWISNLKERNRNIYNDTLQSRYIDLFEFTKSNEETQLKFATDDYNPEEISVFCFRVVDFKEKGQKFKGLRVKKSFNKLFKFAQKVEQYKKNQKFFVISVEVAEEETYLRMYNENKDDFKKLKERFTRFYLSIFDNL